MTRVICADAVSQWVGRGWVVVSVLALMGGMLGRPLWVTKTVRRVVAGQLQHLLCHPWLFYTGQRGGLSMGLAANGFHLAAYGRDFVVVYIFTVVEVFLRTTHFVGVLSAPSGREVCEASNVILPFTKAKSIFGIHAARLRLCRR